MSSTFLAFGIHRSMVVSLFRLLRISVAVASVLLPLGLCAGSTAAPAEDYLLDIGDTLELNVVGIPDLRQRAVIGINGTVSFPLVGDVQAAGRSLEDVRAEVQTALTKQPFRRQATTTSDATVYDIAPEELSLQIVEFRPVYVTGDVAKSGEVAYRPGMSVRQAVAVVGGYGRDREKADLVDMKTKHDQAALDVTQYALEVARLQAELGRTVAAHAPALTGISPAAVSAMAADEEQQRVARVQGLKAEHAVLADAIDQSSRRIEALQSQSTNEEKGADLDAADVARVDELFRKGVVPATRVSEVRRAGLLATSRALETRVALENAIRERAELQAKQNRLDNDRQIELLHDLTIATAKMGSAKLDMQGLDKQLALSGDVESGVQVVIFRKRPGATDRINADEDAELRPGDTVQVTILRESKN